MLWGLGIFVGLIWLAQIMAFAISYRRFLREGVNYNRQDVEADSPQDVLALDSHAVAP